MSTLDLSGSKKRKRNINEKVFKFKNFGEQGFPIEFIGCNFEQNVKLLLEFAQQENVSIWSFQLEVHRHPPMHVVLFVVEEQVELSLNPNCKHCQYIGNIINYMRFVTSSCEVRKYRSLKKSMNQKRSVVYSEHIVM